MSSIKMSILGMVIIASLSIAMAENSGESMAVASVPKNPLESDYSKEPVMCTTVETDWEYCLRGCDSRASEKIMVDVRYKGNDIRLEGCESEALVSCVSPRVKWSGKESLWCIKGDCHTMHGQFNCTTEAPWTFSDDDNENGEGAKCQDISSTHHCKFSEFGNETKICHRIRNCVNLHGMYNCNVGVCNEAITADCTRNCDHIKIKDKSVIVRQGDNIFTAKCKRAINENTTEEIWPLLTNSNDASSQTLMIFCGGAANSASSDTDIHNPIFSDCFDGTLVDTKNFGDTMTDSELRKIHSEAVEKNMAKRDTGTSGTGHGLIGPTESDLMIVRNTRLYINYDDCVDECQRFLSVDGVPNFYDMVATIQPRFECYHSPNSSFGALLKFNYEMN